MTLDEAIKHCEEVAKEKSYDYQECIAVHDMEDAMACGKCSEEHKQLAEWLKELKESRMVLDQIIAEIQRLRGCSCSCSDGIIDDVEDIIDKYKAAEELRMEKHTDRQIYDGCIRLMQNMVDHFQEYLDYLGYDLDELDEDERFAVGISNMEIVRYLFLYHTRKSGGCSTMDFCKKLGVDPYKSVKFEFEESEDKE